MENLFTTKAILHALFTCKSEKDNREPLEGFFKLADGRVYSTDGKRAVIIKHPSLNKLAIGSYKFIGKPTYNKDFVKAIIEKTEFTGPDIDLVIKDIQKHKICEIAFTKKEYALNMSVALARIFNGYKTAINYALLDFLPMDEIISVSTKDINIAENAIGFSYFNKPAEFEFLSVVMPIHWKVVEGKK